MKDPIIVKFFVRMMGILFIVISFWLALVYWIIQDKSADRVAMIVEEAQVKYEKKMLGVLDDLSHIEALKLEMKNRENLLALELVGSVGVFYSATKDNLSTQMRESFQKYRYSNGKFKYKIVSLDNSNRYAILFSKRIKTTIFDGKLKALFLLEKDIADELKKGVYYIFSIVIMTMFLVILTTFPLIFRQYKKLNIEKYRLLRSNIDIISALGNAVAKRDSDTSEHNYRVTIYSIKLAEKLNLSKRKMRGLIKGAFLHDVGKIGISDLILLKPGKLTNDEFEIMKSHVKLGLDIVENISWLGNAKNVISCHHEKVDGSGYPRGLKQDEIPLEARIFAVIDVFDALTSKRPYKKPFEIGQSIDIIKKDVDTHFDKRVVDAFEEIAYKLYEKLRNKNNAELKSMIEEMAKPYFSTI